jgi:sortase A
MTRFRRRLGTVLIVVGAVALVYGAIVYFWRDPATDLYARYKQHQLSQELDKSFAEFQTELGLPVKGKAPPVSSTEPEDPPAQPAAGDYSALEQRTTRAAERFLAQLELGDPLGRIIIPKLGIDPVFVNGTRWGADLSRGPGRYPETSLPGLGKVTAIAGHRTTFGAPFRHIDRLKAGDEITLELAYGTFHYRVVGHEIVDDEDWSIIRPRGYDALVLSACHPLFTAKQRWIVYARLARVEMPDGGSYRPPAAQVASSGTGKTEPGRPS